MAFPREEHTNGSPENIHRSHIIQIEQVVFSNTLTHTHRQHTYTHSCIHAITVFFKSHEFEGEKGEDLEGGNSKGKRNYNLKSATKM